MTKRRSTGKRQSPQKNRRSGSNPAASFSFFRLAWKLVLVLLLLLAGWTIYLDVQITSQFEDHRWEIPSRVFARPLDLYNGAPVTAEAFRNELEVLGYEPAAKVRKQRERYTVDGCTVTLDAVEGLGEFVEAELDVKEEIDAARERLETVLESLGLDPEDQIRTSYLGLLLAEDGVHPEAN